MKDHDLTFAIIKILSLVLIMWGVIPVVCLIASSNHLIDNNWAGGIGAASFFCSMPLLLLLVHYDNKRYDKSEQEEYYRNLDVDPI